MTKKQKQKKLVFKNNAPLRSCISKINNKLTKKVEDLNIVTQPVMYNLLEYSKNYSMISESLSSYYRDEVIDDGNENNQAGNDRINNTAQKMRFSIKDFFSRCDQIRMKLRIRSHLLKKFLMENFVFCAV